jgi:hypothetical protein
VEKGSLEIENVLLSKNTDTAVFLLKLYLQFMPYNPEDNIQYLQQLSLRDGKEKKKAFEHKQGQ